MNYSKFATIAADAGFDPITRRAELAALHTVVLNDAALEPFPAALCDAEGTHYDYLDAGLRSSMPEGFYYEPDALRASIERRSIALDASLLTLSDALALPEFAEAIYRAGIDAPLLAKAHESLTGSDCAAYNLKVSAPYGIDTGAAYLVMDYSTCCALLAAYNCRLPEERRIDQERLIMALEGDALDYLADLIEKSATAALHEAAASAGEHYYEIDCEHRAHSALTMLDALDRVKGGKL